MEQGEHIQRRDEILLELGQRATQGQGRPKSNIGELKNSEENSPILKTTKAIGKEIGLSERVTEQRKQIAADLLPEVKEEIRNTPLADKPTELLKLARMAPAKQRRGRKRSR